MNDEMDRFYIYNIALQPQNFREKKSGSTALLDKLKIKLETA
jgi:hypothetical protein